MNIERGRREAVAVNVITKRIRKEERVAQDIQNETKERKVNDIERTTRRRRRISRSKSKIKRKEEGRYSFTHQATGREESK